MRGATLQIREWRADPCKFVHDVFQAEPDPWQEDLLNAAAVPGRKRIAMKACAGPGKTAGLAWVGWHRMLCYAGPNEHPKGAAVSITRDNLDSNLWAELAKWRNASPLLRRLFEWTASKIFAKDHPETWVLSARGFPKTADTQALGRTLSGLHSQFPFYLIDESGDMAVQILDAAEQGLSNCEDGLIATAGNPTSTTGLLYYVAGAARAGWTIITITGDPEDPRRSPRIDRAWAQEQIERYGRDNPWVMAYILGQFPPGGLNSLLTVDEVEAAMNRHLREDTYRWAQKRLGIDVARFGDDRTVVFPRQGLASFMPAVMRHQRTTDIAARVAQAKAKWGSELELVDDTGHWGHGVIDNLIAAGFGPIGIQFHGPALDPRYKNRRAEMWMKMAEWVRNGGALPGLPELVGELTAPTYTFAQGKFQLEDKDQVKKRLGRSPDLGDALALTFALPDQPAALETLIPGLRRKPDMAEPDDYDPFEGWD